MVFQQFIYTENPEGLYLETPTFFNPKRNIFI